MEKFKGCVRSVVAFAGCFVGLTMMFSLMLILVPTLAAYTVFKADKARTVLRQETDGDSISILVNDVISFVLRLAPDCPDQEPMP